MKLRSLLLATLWLLLCGCQGETQKIGDYQMQSGAGISMVEIQDDDCYLVEDSGIIYRLDWETGEREMYLRGPEHVDWVADPSLSRLYYLRDGMLYRMDKQGDETPLCAVRDGMLLCVTEHYALIRCGIYDTETASTINCVDLETLQFSEDLRLSEDQQFACLLAQEGDTVYLMTYNPSRIRAYTQVEAWDLASEESRILAAYEHKIIVPSNAGIQYTDCGALVNGKLYYFDYVNAALYAVETDGTAPAEQCAMTGAKRHKAMMISENGRCLAVLTQIGNAYKSSAWALYTYDLQMDTVSGIALQEACTDVYAVASDPSRFVALVALKGQKKLIWGPLRCESA